MVTYIGSKRVGSTSDYNKLSTSEKVIASRSPEVTKILSGVSTVSQELAKNRKVKQETQKYLQDVKIQNLEILGSTKERMLKSWSQKYSDVGAEFNQQGMQTTPSANARRQELGLAQPQDNTMLYLLVGIALLGALK